MTLEYQMDKLATNMHRAVAEIDRLSTINAELRTINAELLAAAKLAIGLYGGPPAYYRFDQLKAVIKRVEEPSGDFFEKAVKRPFQNVKDAS